MPFLGLHGAETLIEMHSCIHTDKWLCLNAANVDQ